AFGEVLNQTGATENSYLFTGEQFDQELNQYYLRVRYYNQATGRFTQQDTWMGRDHDPITLNKYVYGNADPVRYVDPSGYFGIADIGSALNIREIQTTSAQASFRVTVREIGKDLVCVAIEEAVSDMILQQLTGGIYIFPENGTGYVGRTNDFDRCMREHGRAGRRNAEGILAKFHMDPNVNDMRLVEQFFMDLFREAHEPLTNQRNSIARNPSSSNSRTLRRLVDRIDFCD
ncbi:MAG: RHS repeat-associated core domain-containing protein, partial [Gammaproteobacteria bacterium]